MLAIELKNVTYEYETEQDNLIALNNLSLTVEEGKFVCILGGNGSGKSTFAKLLNGLLIPTKGEIKVFGKSTADDTKGGIYEIRSNIGMVFQNPDNQMVASIIEDDIAFGPENLGIPREEIKSRIDWALEVTGMTAFRKHTPFKLSGGQKQRIAIASVLAMKPKILVLDESTAMLDPTGRKEVMDVLHYLNKQEGITVFLITHYMEEVRNADEVFVLNKGKLTFFGTPQQLFSDKNFVESNDLELPPLENIIHLFGEQGIKIEEDIKDEKSLADCLWRLK